MAQSNYSDAAIAAIAAAIGLAPTGLVAVTTADVAGSIPAGGTGMAAGGYDTAMNRDTMLATLAEVKATVNDALADLHTMGLPITIT